MKIYTKKGDSGKTALLSERISKTSLRIKVNGEIDELMVLLAYLIEEIKHNDFCGDIKVIYRNLFTITTMIDDSKKEYNISLDEIVIQKLEKNIDELEKKVPPLKNFIFYTGTKTSILCQEVRGKVRSVERSAVFLYETEEIDNNILIYLNRLSDYFYLLGRYINKAEGYEEEILK